MLSVFVFLELCILIFLFQGIRFLIDSSLLKNTSDDIAKFLYKGEGLNKTAIGDYLGERWGDTNDASSNTRTKGLFLIRSDPESPFFKKIILMFSRPNWA